MPENVNNTKPVKTRVNSSGKVGDKSEVVNITVDVIGVREASAWSAKTFAEERSKIENPSLQDSSPTPESSKVGKVGDRRTLLGVSDTVRATSPDEYGKTGSNEASSSTRLPTSPTPKTEKYGCGHEGKMIVMNSDPLSLSAYLEWKDTVGFDGDKSKCFPCWCEENRGRSK